MNSSYTEMSISPGATTTYWRDRVDIWLEEEIYTYTSVPCLLLSIMTVILNIFLVRFYWKRELTIVPLLYTLIASLDTVCAIGVIYEYFVVLLVIKENINGRSLHDQAKIFYFLIQVSYRCSVFCNLVLAVSRTIMILKPFYQINLKFVKLACILYAVPWIVLNGINLHEFRDFYYNMIYQHGFLIGAGISIKVSDIYPYYEDSLYVWYIILILPDLIAFIFPVIIVIITCIIQVISVWRSSQFPTSSNQRHVTITVLLMSVLFVLCNSVHFCYEITLIAALLIGNIDLKNALTLGNMFEVIGMLSTSVFPMLNAALNPVIIITRSSELRRSFLDFLRRMVRGVRSSKEERRVPVVSHQDAPGRQLKTQETSKTVCID